MDVGDRSSKWTYIEQAFGKSSVAKVTCRLALHLTEHALDVSATTLSLYQS